jgi:hypothetical protein
VYFKALPDITSKKEVLKLMFRYKQVMCNKFEEIEFLKNLDDILEGI